jgi:hypothetical protein
MSKSLAVSVLHFVASGVIAIALLVLGAAAADMFHLPFIHGWALAHGTIFIMFPAYYLLAYFGLRPIAQRFWGASATAASGQSVSFLAVVSLLLSGFGFIIPLIGSILGIVSGHLARHRCKDNPKLTGSGLALAGLILGYLGLAYSVYVVLMVSMTSHGS